MIGIFRDIRNTEIELILSWRNDPNVRRNMYTRHEISLEEHIDWWQHVCSTDDIKYFIYEVDETPLGVVGFSQIDEVNSNCSWAFYSSPNAPKGSGSRMEFLAIDYAFSVLGLNKLHCEVLAFNSSVIKLHEKFGFRIEGIFRQHHLFEGSFIDIYRLGLLSSEWIAKRDQMLEKVTPRRKR